MFRRLAEEGAAATRESLATAGPLDLVEASRRAFADFAPDIAGAAVFLDDGAAETAHYACGASFLLGLGATNVFALPDANSVRSTTSGTPTNGANPSSSNVEQNEDDRRRRSRYRDVASLVDVAGAPLPASTPVVIFTHRFLNVVAPDVVEVVRQRPETSRVFVATAATAEAHAADARAAARAAGASAAAANEIANDAKAKQERALRTAVTAILKAHQSHDVVTHGRDAVTHRTEKKTPGSGGPETLADARRADRADEDDAFEDDADWGDWGSYEDDDTTELSRSNTVNTVNTVNTGDPRLDALSLVETRHVARSDEEEDEDEETKSRFAAAYFPAPFVPLSAGAFVFPADSAAATASLRGSRSERGSKPEAESRKDAETTSRSHSCPSYEDGTEEDGGDAPAPAGVGVLAATLAQFGFSACGFSKLECFAIGRVARAVARAVSAAGPPAEADFEHSRRGGRNGKPCALLLVDRVADVLTPALDEAFRGDDDDAFLAAALRISRRRCRSYPASFASAEFTFERELRSGNVGDDDDSDDDHDHSRRRSCGTHEVTLPGAYAHPNDAEARRFADASQRRTLLETAIAARRWVADAAREEGVFLPSETTPGETSPETSRSAEVSPAFLRSTLVPFLKDPRLRLRRGAMTHAVALVAACLEDRARERRLRESADAGEDASADSECSFAFSFADAVREMTRDAGNAVAARAGEGAAAAAVAASLRRTLSSATTERRRTKAKEGERISKIENRGLTRASAAVLAVAAYALAGEAAAFERNALGLGRVDFSSLNDEEEEDEENETDDARFRAALAFRSDEKAKREKAKRVASASPFGSRDESLLRDALADFVVQSFASSKQSDEDEANLTEQNENLAPSDEDDWLGNDLAAKLAAAARRASGDSRESPEMFADSRESPRSLLGETRDGVERFLRRCGDVARARRRYASCGGLVDFAEAVTANDAIENRRLDAHRSLAKELAERVSVGADGGRRIAAETNLDCSRDSYDPCDDVTHVASSLGGFLKHGVENVLGSFGLRGPTLVSKPKPSDSPTVLIFFLGGITAREIRDVRAAAANLAVGVFGENAENGAQVEDILVGSTGLLRAEGEDLVGMVA